MKKSTSTLVDRLIILATAIIFCVALFVLFREFANVRAHDVVTSFGALPGWRLLLAAGLSLASYLFLCGYDLLALRYVGRRLRLRDVLYVSFTSFAFSNSIGFQFLSGGSLRYRLYSGFGLKAVEIGEIVVFCTFTYVLGVVTLSGVLALSSPAAMASLLRLPQSLIVAVGIGLTAITVIWLMIAAVWREPIAFGRFRLRPPSLLLALAQVAFAVIDAVLAATVMYVLVPADPTFWSFLNVYLVAATAAVLSEVPSGLGVMEMIVTVMTAPESKAAELGALVAYRIIYYVVPLVAAMVLMVWCEFRLWFRGGISDRGARMPIASLPSSTDCRTMGHHGGDDLGGSGVREPPSSLRSGGAGVPSATRGEEATLRVCECRTGTSVGQWLTKD